MTIRERMAGSRLNPLRFFMQDQPNELERLNDLLEIATGVGTLGAASSRNSGMFSSSTLFRVVVLTSQSIGWLMRNGLLRVIDRHGRTVETRRTESVLNLVTGKPDGETDCQQFWTDWSVDFCTYGNAFMQVGRDMQFVPNKLYMMNADDADLLITRNGSKMYTLSNALDPAKRRESFDTKNVCHARWPRVAAMPNVKLGFGPSPLELLRDAVLTEFILQMKVRDSATRPNIAVILDSIGKVDSGPVARSLRRNMKMGSTEPVLLTQKGTVQDVQNNISGETLVKLIELVSRHTSRIYGVSGPVMGENATNWGSGINELVRAYYRFGLRGHFGAVLSGIGAKLLLNGQSFAIDETVLSSGDYKSVAAFINALRGNGKYKSAISAEEMRRLSGMPLEMAGKPLEPIVTPKPDVPPTGGNNA